MKRTGIIALAAGCAMGVTALVGGVGYASALDVAEQTGRTLDVSGVSTVDESSSQLADSPKLDPSAEPTDDATADDTASDPSAADDGTADQGSGDAVDEVDPSDPVVIGDDVAGKAGKDCGDHAAWFGAHKGDKTGDGAGRDAASDPAKNRSGEKWSGTHGPGDGPGSSWSGKDGSGTRGSGDKGSGWGKGDGGHRGGGGGWGGGRH
ncbi:MAG: hypothetical protein J0H23_02320 [Micrococcales bacterium]|nr:hypothetical protein [Micrococcales bacterium]OJX66488.1 MAG: hypothetical protein BGO94_06365 [Micrococcales bacterium 72-143]